MSKRASSDEVSLLLALNPAPFKRPRSAGTGYIARSKTDSHGTPSHILDEVGEKFGKIAQFDPCPLSDSPSVNGLLSSFPREGVVFVNPPYSALKSTKKSIGWVEKCHKESLAGSHVVMLIPARTDTTWFHDIILANNHTVHFIRGRITFVGSKSGAPFPCVYIDMKPACQIK
jgi:site-specific DNA-methyltransferase (adenine-specific)